MSEKTENIIIGAMLAFVLIAGLIGLTSCGSTETADGYVTSVIVEPNEIMTYSTANRTTASADTESNGIYVEFESKVDGDTAWFHTSDDSSIKVRFLGIDTPETVKEDTEVQPWGPEASEYTTDRLSHAEKIYLEFDPNSDREDAYGRTLAWVWVDGSLLEKELVEQGYAEVAYIYGDYLYTDMLYDAQAAAQEQGIGMWGNFSADAA